MENRKFVFVYGLDKCLCRSSEEAINFINKLQRCGINLICNEICSTKIKALFEGNLFYLEKDYIDYIIYNDKRFPGFKSLATTGCGANRIKIYPALADTLEEHEAINKSKLDEEKKKYLKSKEESHEKRLNELNEQRKGWYAVCLNFNGSRYKSSIRTNAPLTFSWEIIAESGMDAYEKTVEHLENSGDTFGNLYPTADSDSYWFEFLGVKNDDGYSIEQWHEWKEKYDTPKA